MFCLLLKYIKVCLITFSHESSSSKSKAKPNAPGHGKRKSLFLQNLPKSCRELCLSLVQVRAEPCFILDRTGTMTTLFNLFQPREGTRVCSYSLPCTSKGALSSSLVQEVCSPLMRIKESSRNIRNLSRDQSHQGRYFRGTFGPSI